MRTAKARPRPEQRPQAAHVAETARSGLAARTFRKPAVILALLLAGYVSIECFLPLGTAIQIGADEGFNLAKATLCLKGFRLYTDVWNDQPPLHTFLITQILRHISPSVLGPRLLSVGFALLLLASLFGLVLRISSLAVAAITTAMFIASPGFIELSSSCMLEIPAVAAGMSALWVLAGTERGSVSRSAHFLAGLIFGAAIQIKFAPAVLLPTAILIIALGRSKLSGEPKGPALPLLALLAGLLAGWLLIDLLTDRFAYLLHFQQSWASHFAAPKSFEYGSASEHRFDWSILLKNWDATIPACIGLFVLLSRVRHVTNAAIPLAWLAVSFSYFAIHRPWWNYYYIHIAIPLCWCAASGIEFAWLRAQQRRAKAALTALVAFLLAALPWMAGRVCLQARGIRNSPQTYSSLVLSEINRFKPFTQWLYAADLVYSFHSGVPVPPDLAVMSLKRVWSGGMTNARVAEEVAAIKPGLILLRNDTREMPFQDLLDKEYRLVYQDERHRLYAHRSISKKPYQT